MRSGLASARVEFDILPEIDGQGSARLAWARMIHERPGSGINGAILRAASDLDRPSR